MNIRIENNSIRFRINGIEFDRLLNNEIITNKVNLSIEHSFEYSIHNVDRVLELYLIPNTNHWKLEVSTSALLELKNKFPTKYSISHNQIVNPGSDKHTIKIIFDVDARISKF